MGKIETTILENYKKALLRGNLNQAKKSVELIKKLRFMIENDSFIDYEYVPKSSTLLIGNALEPVPYRYYPSDGIVVFFNSTINLTETENKLFYLLSQKETHGDEINIISKDEIKNYVWPEKEVTGNSVRILIKRLRLKIEPKPTSPQVLINFNRKGYVFVASKAA